MSKSGFYFYEFDLEILRARSCINTVLIRDSLDDHFMTYIAILVSNN